MNNASEINTSTVAANWKNWHYSAGIPQRYGQNYKRYVAGGGLVRPEDDVGGFVAGKNGNRADMARFYFFCLAFDQLTKEGIKGDVAELGVYNGNTASLLAQFARRSGSMAYLLDTFEGFSQTDLTGVDAGQQVQFADTSLEAVRAAVGEDHVQFVKGHFPESASQIPDDVRFSLVHIDCDLYTPMAHALRYFYPRLLPGGFILLHDYSSLHWPGVERAVDEFFATTVECPVPLPDSAGSVTLRKAKAVDMFANWLVQRRAALLANGWAQAADGALSELLGAGWSGREKFGVWGIGSTHEVSIYMSAVPSGKILLQVDGHAVLIGDRTELEIDVLVGGSVLTTWLFTRTTNRASRSVVIPLSIALTAIKKGPLPAINVIFHLHSAVSPAELDPGHPDKRRLGLGLIAMRVDMN